MVCPPPGVCRSSYRSSLRRVAAGPSAGHGPTCGRHRRAPQGRTQDRGRHVEGAGQETPQRTAFRFKPRRRVGRHDLGGSRQGRARDRRRPGVAGRRARRPHRASCRRPASSGCCATSPSCWPAASPCRSTRRARPSSASTSSSDAGAKLVIVEDAAQLGKLMPVRHRLCTVTRLLHMAATPRWRSPTRRDGRASAGRRVEPGAGRLLMSLDDLRAAGRRG